MVIHQFFKQPGLTPIAQDEVFRKIVKAAAGREINNLETEVCYYVCSDTHVLSSEDEKRLLWILSTPFQENKMNRNSYFHQESDNSLVIEIGPRLNFSTPFSTNAVSICHSIGLKHISRIECATRYNISLVHNSLTKAEETNITSALHDRMTQCRYETPISSFESYLKTEPVFHVDILGKGEAALEQANKDLGLAFDEWDINYYTHLFKDKIKRNPTSVECFDLAQSNSEHSRHWFFKGRLTIDGEENSESMFQMIMNTQETSNDNNVIKFNDNSSGIKGHTVTVLLPDEPWAPSILSLKADVKRHIIFTAETHNFPTGVAPFPGATTGTGGRIRDVQCTGRGAHVLAGTAGYSYGNLHIPGYKLPWEDESFLYPAAFASPLEIVVEASNGASDYGNKFGEPVLAGFSRSFGVCLPSGERREYVKPIMFSAGIGTLEDDHIKKELPDKGMEVVKIGGPVYRIGMGGGAASSVQVQGDNKSDLDFGAVQRGDAEMEQKLNRVIRACIEMGAANPLCSLHDQGAGGNGNVLKEIVEPAGAVIRASDFQLGDPTLSIMELWGAEYQESNAALVRNSNKALMKTIGRRERCPVDFVGTVTGDGKIKLENFSPSDPSPDAQRQTSEDVSTHKEFPVDLDLEFVLGTMPRKTFTLTRSKPVLTPLILPENLQIRDALDRVLRLPSVASKRYLTNKVDRSVTGLIAQQQCVGPLHTPLADVAVTASSYFDKVGSATAIGEQPIKGLVDAGCGARMSVGEALTNLVFSRITDIKDIKCSGNWMWPAKLPGEGSAILDACQAMCGVMRDLGIAVDGGKDSLSMAARVGRDTVKAPGTLVISAYAPCPDITATVTPDLKCPDGTGILLHIDLGGAQHRLGGSALAQCYKQIGDVSPDLDDPKVFSQAFKVTQQLIAERKIKSGHDISDGGLVTCVLEMAFAGCHGLNIDLTSDSAVSPIEALFSEELGLVLEVRKQDLTAIQTAYRDANVPCQCIGKSLNGRENSQILICVNGQLVLDDRMEVLRDVWEETSFQLERRQANPRCVMEEQTGLSLRRVPPYSVTFDPNAKPENHNSDKPRIAVIREEGSNGDREMAAAFHMAGFEVWDVNMEDLCCSQMTLDRFQGIAFVGGFSYADVCGSAKGWAATAMFNEQVKKEFEKFYAREDTFSLGVCNGCQLMSLLGWVAPGDSGPNESGDCKTSNQGVFFDHNTSERYESRFATVRIQESPAIMLTGMEGTVFGMWVSHGEGKMVFKSSSVYDNVCRQKLMPVQFVDDDGHPTMAYPLNPNGSPDGAAALCSPDGRHLAIMPHPERCFLPWQCPWMSQETRASWEFSPWMKMFRNAYDWCLSNNSYHQHS